MTEKRTYPLLPDEPCLTQEQFFRYIDGKMAAAEMHAAEKHLLDCGLCSDALDGLRLVRNREKMAAFVPPVAGAENETEEKPGPVVVSIFRRPALWYSAAASVTLILGITALLKFSFSESDSSNEAPRLAENKTQLMDSISASRPDDGKDKTQEENQAIASGPSNDRPQSGELNDGDKSAPDLSQKIGTAAEQSVSSGKPNAAEKTMAAPPMDLDMAETDDVLLEEPSSGATARSEAADESKKEERNKLKNISDKVLDAVAKKDQSSAQTKAGLSAKESATSAPPAASGGTGMSDINEQENSKTYSQSDTISQTGPFPLKATDQDIDLSYVNGVRMLESGQTAASIVFFDEVLKYPAHRYYQDAQWKKAEALIKLNRKEEAKQILNTIVAKEGKYKILAQEKLKIIQ